MGGQGRQTLENFPKQGLRFMKYLLDTNIIVGYLRDKSGKRKLIKKLFSQGDLAVSLITYGELEYGACRAKEYKTEKGKVEQCFA